MAASALLEQIRRDLRRHADPAKAVAMQRYMKSEMPYRGVPAPLLRRICREAFSAHPFAQKEAWRATTLETWRDAAHREERYAAIELAGLPRYFPFRTFDTLRMFEEMVVTGAWWDTVDPIAGHRLRELLERYPRGMSRRMRAWSRSPNLWKRRSSILCQLGRKARTDLELLFACVEPNLGDREFFIRKAIGWALRSYAWYDIDTIERYVEEQGDRLSPLSRREALKNRDKLRRRKS